MSGNVPLEQCFKEAEETGRLNLSCKNLRDFPDPADDYELIDVIEAGKNICKSLLALRDSNPQSAQNFNTNLLSRRSFKKQTFGASGRTL